MQYWKVWPPTDKDTQYRVTWVHANRRDDDATPPPPTGEQLAEIVEKQRRNYCALNFLEPNSSAAMSEAVRLLPLFSRITTASGDAWVQLMLDKQGAIQKFADMPTYSDVDSQALYQWHLDSTGVTPLRINTLKGAQDRWASAHATTKMNQQPDLNKAVPADPRTVRLGGTEVYTKVFDAISRPPWMQMQKDGTGYIQSWTWSADLEELVPRARDGGDAPPPYDAATRPSTLTFLNARKQMVATYVEKYFPLERSDEWDTLVRNAESAYNVEDAEEVLGAVLTEEANRVVPAIHKTFGYLLFWTSSPPLPSLSGDESDGSAASDTLAEALDFTQKRELLKAAYQAGPQGAGALAEAVRRQASYKEVIRGIGPKAALDRAVMGVEALWENMPPPVPTKKKKADSGRSSGGGQSRRARTDTTGIHPALLKLETLRLERAARLRRRKIFLDGMLTAEGFEAELGKKQDVVSADRWALLKQRQKELTALYEGYKEAIEEKNAFKEAEQAYVDWMSTIADEKERSTKQAEWAFYQDPKNKQNTQSYYTIWKLTRAAEKRLEALKNPKTKAPKVDGKKRYLDALKVRNQKIADVKASAPNQELRRWGEQDAEYAALMAVWYDRPKGLFKRLNEKAEKLRLAVEKLTDAGGAQHFRTKKAAKLLQRWVEAMGGETNNDPDQTFTQLQLDERYAKEKVAARTRPSRRSYFDTPFAERVKSEAKLRKDVTPKGHDMLMTSNIEELLNKAKSDDDTFSESPETRREAYENMDALYPAPTFFAGRNEKVRQFVRVMKAVLGKTFFREYENYARGVGAGYNLDKEARKMDADRRAAWNALSVDDKAARKQAELDAKKEVHAANREQLWKQAITEYNRTVDAEPEKYKSMSSRLEDVAFPVFHKVFQQGVDAEDPDAAETRDVAAHMRWYARFVEGKSVDEADQQVKTYKAQRAEHMEWRAAAVLDRKEYQWPPPFVEVQKRMSNQLQHYNQLKKEYARASARAIDSELMLKEMGEDLEVANADAAKKQVADDLKQEIEKEQVRYDRRLAVLPGLKEKLKEAWPVDPEMHLLEVEQAATAYMRKLYELEQARKAYAELTEQLTSDADLKRYTEARTDDAYKNFQKRCLDMLRNPEKLPDYGELLLRGPASTDDEDAPLAQYRAFKAEQGPSPSEMEVDGIEAGGADFQAEVARIQKAARQRKMNSLEAAQAREEEELGEEGVRMALSGGFRVSTRQEGRPEDDQAETGDEEAEERWLADVYHEVVVNTLDMNVDEIQEFRRMEYDRYCAYHDSWVAKLAKGYANAQRRARLSGKEYTAPPIPGPTKSAEAEYVYLKYLNDRIGHTKKLSRGKARSGFDGKSAHQAERARAAGDKMGDGVATWVQRLDEDGNVVYGQALIMGVVMKPGTHLQFLPTTTRPTKNGRMKTVYVVPTGDDDSANVGTKNLPAGLAEKWGDRVTDLFRWDRTEGGAIVAQQPDASDHEAMKLYEAVRLHVFEEDVGSGAVWALEVKKEMTSAAKETFDRWVKDGHLVLQESGVNSSDQTVVLPSTSVREGGYINERAATQQRAAAAKWLEMQSDKQADATAENVVSPDALERQWAEDDMVIEPSGEGGRDVEEDSDGDESDDGEEGEEEAAEEGEEEEEEEEEEAKFTTVTATAAKDALDGLLEASDEDDAEMGDDADADEEEDEDEEEEEEEEDEDEEDEDYPGDDAEEEEDGDGHVADAAAKRTRSARASSSRKAVRSNVVATPGGSGDPIMSADEEEEEEEDDGEEEEEAVESDDEAVESGEEEGEESEDETMDGMGSAMYSPASAVSLLRISVGAKTGASSVRKVVPDRRAPLRTKHAPTASAPCRVWWGRVPQK